ncbi:MAG: hypothetical protein ABIG37_03800 [Nanoarchaeota archaeon]|nr:hypothetical protein [Nanoarchaeota archaeon]
MTTFIDYVGKRKNKAIFSFRKNKKKLGILEVPSFFPYTSIRDEKQANEILEIIKAHPELSTYPSSFYDWNKSVAHILLPPQKAKLFRDVLNSARKKSYRSQPRIDKLLRWGFNPLNKFQGWPKETYKFTPFWNHHVSLSHSLESELEEKSIAQRNNLDDINEIGDYLSFKEIAQQRIVFYDSETTQFMNEDNSIDWGTLLFVENGKIIRGEHHTRRNVTKNEHDGFYVARHNTAKEILEQGVAKSINEFDPWIICVFNSNFDLWEVPQRSEARLGIDINGINPRKKVTLKTRERFLIPGREVFDICSLAKFYFKYLPNSKLDTLAKFLSEKWEIPWQGKSVSYEELAELSISEKQEDLERVMDYNKGDVTAIYNLIFSPNSHLLEDTAEIARTSEISLTEACNREFSVESLRDKSHFVSLGVHKDVGYSGKLRMDAARIYAKKKQKYKQNLLEQKKSPRIEREELTDAILDIMYKTHEEKHKHFLLHTPEIKKGRFENVSQVYIPWGILSQKILAKRFQETRDFTSVYYQAQETERKHGIAQWTSGLAEKLFIDSYFFEKEKQNLEKMLSESKLNETFFRALFGADLHDFYKEYERDSSEKRKRVAINKFLKPEGIKLLKKLKQEKNWNFEIFESFLDQYKLKEAHYSGFLGTHGCYAGEFREDIQRQIDRTWESFKGEFVNLKSDYLFIQDYSPSHSCPLVLIKENFPLISLSLGNIVYENQRVLMGCGLQRPKKKSPEEIAEKTKDIKSLLERKTELSLTEIRKIINS